MIKLKISEIYLEDLKEDIILNIFPMYDFLGKDIEKAFWFGYVFLEVIDKLQGIQPYLYSKPLRHITEEILPYQNQLNFWNDKYWKVTDKKDTEIFDLYSYILNNMFYNNDLDCIKIAVRFGELIHKKLNNEKEKK